MNARLAGIPSRARQERKSARGNALCPLQISCRTDRRVRVTLFRTRLELASRLITFETDQRFVGHGRGHNGKATTETAGPGCGADDTVGRDAAIWGCRASLLEDAGRFSSVADVLVQVARSSARSGAKGPVQTRLNDRPLARRVEVDRLCRYPVPPRSRVAIRSLTGVMEVEEI